MEVSDIDSPSPPPSPGQRRWEAIAAAATFAFGGGLFSLVLVGMAWFLTGGSFRWPLDSGFVTVCIVAVLAGLPILVIDRIRHREDNKQEG